MATHSRSQWWAGSLWKTGCQNIVSAIGCSGTGGPWTRGSRFFVHHLERTALPYRPGEDLFALVAPHSPRVGPVGPGPHLNAPSERLRTMSASSHEHPELGPPELIEVADRVFAYVQPDGTWYINNTGFVVGDDSVISVDACSTNGGPGPTWTGSRR